MLAHERRQAILDLLQRNGAVTVTDLSKRFGVVPITIRRDLEQLEAEKQLMRIHGGAVTVARPFVHRSLQDKETLNHQAKARIGSKAASLVNDGETIILDEGSTCLQIARALTERKGITVVTNGIKVAMELIPYPDITTIVMGGVCGHQNYVAYGHDTVESFKKIRAHKYFMGIDGLQSGYGISDGDPHQIPLKTVKASAAEQVIGVADSSKIGRIGVARIGPIGMMDVLIMDGPIPDAFRELLAREEVDVLEV